MISRIYVYSDVHNILQLVPFVKRAGRVLRGEDMLQQLHWTGSSHCGLAPHNRPSSVRLRPKKADVSLVADVSAIADLAPAAATSVAG